MLRNAAIVLGNQRDQQGIPALVRALDDSEPLVRGAAAWALGQFELPDARAALMQRMLTEEDPAVCAEITAALIEPASITSAYSEPGDGTSGDRIGQ
jgi:epoxyqueuosine reductase